MNLRIKHLLSKQTLTNLKSISTISPLTIHGPHTTSLYHNPIKPHLANPPFFYKTFHTGRALNHTARAIQKTHEQEEDEATMNEFLSRFVHTMRGKLIEGYPDSDKPTINAMLVVIVEKLMSEMEKGGNLEERLGGFSDDFSEDLWKTVWEVSNNVYQDMEREKKKEKMKVFLQSDDVKSMARFASEVGVRGDMLHELRFKWALDEMEKNEFFGGVEDDSKMVQSMDDQVDNVGGDSKMVQSAVELEGNDGGVQVEEGRLPKRHGKFKYKMYGLDLSSSKWREVADKVHEAGESIYPQEAKAISGKCRLVMEKILGLSGNDDYESIVAPLLNDWKELLLPNRVDWICLLEKLKEKDCSLYLKVAEHLLDEPSFQANVRDYSKLIDAHAKENKVEDMERLLKRMTESGMPPDILTLTTLLHMYSKTNNLVQAKEAYEALTSQGFKPNMDVYNSMILLYVNVGEPKKGEAVLRDMELRHIKPTQQIYIALLQAFAKDGDIIGAKRIVTSMQFAGFQPTQESCTLLIEACDKFGKSGNSDEARNNFEYMMKLGFKPDDRSTSLVISAYARNNELDRALSLLLKLEKDGFEPGVSTYCVLVDWMGKLQLVDEAEQILAKIAQLGEAPPFKIQVSLCDMYARAGIEKKALQALRVVEAKKDLLESKDFERIIRALIKGGFMQDALRMQEVMKSQGFTPSDSLGLELMTAQVGKSGGRRPGMS